MDTRHYVTTLLLDAQAGDQASVHRLVDAVYDELRRIAHRQLAQERPDHSMSTTDLVHEAYLRLVDQTRVQWKDRAHFLGVAATVMRRILLDYARRRQAAKRGGGQLELGVTDALHLAEERADSLIALDSAIARLSLLDERLAQVVECRFFGGLTEEETAAVVGVTSRTVRRDWVKARGWLYRELSGDAAP
ncbi:MAG: sigma-70 family RNA polymerase sigma factor [Gemmatimonadetes bacterium]|nr:sigma-70 family RNA polymerase sigma factor [Gemmatimonadota bacterium]